MVSSAIGEDLLIGWKDLKAWGSIPSDFPNAHEEVHQVRAMKSEWPGVEPVAPARDAKLSEDEVWFKQEVEKVLVEFEGTVSDEFTENTRMACKPMNIELIEGARPRKCRTVKQAQAAELKEKLVKTGVLRGPHNKHRAWIAPTKYVEKPNGKGLRFVVDMTGLNRAVKRSPHPFMSAHDMRKSIKATS